MIVKIQLPIMGDEALIYDEERSFAAQTSNPDVFKAMDGLGIKAYFQADIEDGLLVIGDQVKDRNW